jgi:hypothetical protein
MDEPGADLFILTNRSDEMTTIAHFNATEVDWLKIEASVFGYLGIFTPVVGTDTNLAVSELYFNSDAQILSHDPDGAGTFHQRINVAYMPEVTTMWLHDLVTF